MTAGQAHKVHQLRNLEEFPREGEDGPKVPKMIPKKEFCLLSSLSEIGSNSDVVFPKVSSQVEFHMAGTA